MINTKLDRESLLRAYSEGYFPMPDPETGEIQWYYPDPRAILPLDRFHRSRSLIRTIRKSDFSFSIDRAFENVIHGCADREETWINPEFIRAYTDLHKAGFAHSAEVWQGSRLVGGVYGIHLRGAFFAESMFHAETGGSKAALGHLVDHLKSRHIDLLEVQFLTPHLQRLGAIVIPAAEYRKRLEKAMKVDAHFSD